MCMLRWPIWPWRVAQQCLGGILTVPRPGQPQLADKRLDCSGRFRPRIGKLWPLGQSQLVFVWPVVSVFSERYIKKYF